MREPLAARSRNKLLQEVLEIAGRPGALRPRLSSARPERALTASALSLWPRKPHLPASAAELLSSAAQGREPADLHAAGVALLVTGKALAAAERLRDAVLRQPRSEWWNDLAAAEISAGDMTKDVEHYVTALDAADRALALHARLPEAHFNRALIIEKLGFQQAALADWRHFVAADPNSQWSLPARAHMNRLASRPTARDAWAAANTRFASLASAELERLVDAYPQEARLWGETMLLSDWARMHLAGDAGADRYLAQTRLVANRIRSRAGERLLYDAILAIDRTASADRDRTAKAQLTYLEGRIALSGGTIDDAAAKFRDAAVLFAGARSPMRDVAELYLAMTAIQQNRHAVARVALGRLLERQRAPAGHYALAGEAGYFAALCDGVQGQWGDALAAATRSLETFQRLGERANAGEAEMLIGDLLAFLGQPRLAWPHHVRAAAAFSAAGESDRLQVCAGTMNQLEMRRRRWDTARAISKIELVLNREEPHLLAHAQLRKGAAEWQSGAVSDAQSTLREAKTAASAVRDANTREKLLMDIAAVEARVVAATAPATAIDLLTRAIDFQNRVGRAFALPELHLERGRARLATNGRDAALADFEAGIRSLEVQRSHIRDYALRDGMFDDARALFGDAAAASLDSGNPEKAFEYAERGRARALLDELANGVTAPRPATVAEIRESLSSGTVLVSWLLLPDRVVIFTIDRDGASVAQSSAGAESVRAAAAALIRQIRSGGDMTDTAATLYDALLLPIRAQLANATSLIIVPEATLEQVPFATLYDRRTNTFLVESHESLIAPSAGVFVACARRLRRLQETGSAQSLAIFANPTGAAAKSLPFLASADAEAPAIAQRYRQSAIMRRALATASEFATTAPKYDVVQFSGHATVNRAERWRSALMMDVPLTARDISSMRFSRTRLVILAGCSTLAPDDTRVEGTSPVARSFVVAGVPAVIGALWDVDDAQSAAFTIRLHELLARGVRPMRALRDVQRQFLKDPVRRDPAIWAAFTLLGADGMSDSARPVAAIRSAP